MKKAIEATSYAALRAEQKEKRAAFARGETRELMGIGVAFFTEIVGAGPTRNCDILGVGMFDSCEIRIHPTGAARSEEHTSELQSLMRISYAVFCLKKKTKKTNTKP